MGQQESISCHQDFTCQIPVLSSCYSGQQRQRAAVNESTLRQSKMSGVIRKAYQRMNRLSGSRVLADSNANLSNSKQGGLAPLQKAQVQFSHSQHAKIFNEQQDQLKLYLSGRSSNHSARSELPMSKGRMVTSMYQDSTTNNMTFDFEQKLLQLPNDILFNILSFVMLDYSNLIQVNSLWYLKFHQAVDSYLLQVDNKFIKAYMQFFSLKNAYTSYTNFRVSAQQGFRLDRNVVAEVLPKLQNKLITFGYEYQYKGKSEIRKNSYRVLIQRSNVSRSIWINYDECSNNYDVVKQAMIQPITPVCIGDNLKIATNIFNLGGIVDLSSVKWFSPIIEEVGSVFANTHKLLRVPTSLEPPQADWVLYDYCEQPNKVRLNSFEPQLTLKETRCRGYGLVVNKMVYVANRPGRVEAGILNINITVRRQNEEVTNEVKRIGLIQDLENTLELREGDKIILYYIKGGGSE